MLEEVDYCKATMTKHFKKPLVMSDDEEEMFKQTEVCYICGQQYTDADIRVRDHCHVTGKYRGSAHQDCNLKLCLNPNNVKIRVIFYNLRGYDAHFFMQAIGKIGKEKKLDIHCIPNNMERYMALMLGKHLVFLDSFQLMASSLDRLAANLPEGKFKYTSQAFKSEELTLMQKKGVYPYDFIDSSSKFNHPTLPTKDAFFSMLTNEGISDEQYNHAHQVWNKFGLTNMGEYHDLYLRSDILLLSDVFENFRQTGLQYYYLDPDHYFTSPGLSWSAMLKMTGIKLELMTDIDMFHSVEKVCVVVFPTLRTGIWKPITHI